MASGDGQKINRIITDAQLAVDASNYADSIVCDVELNSGTDYTLVWTTAYTGEFPPEE